MPRLARPSLFLTALISLSIFRIDAFAEDSWRKVAPFRTSRGPLPAAKLKSGCQYRFAWQLPSPDGSKKSVSFEAGKFFSENPFYLTASGVVRTEISENDLSLLKPLLNFGDLIDKIELKRPEYTRALYYLSWQSGSSAPGDGLFSLIISWISSNGASNNFINLNPEDSISMEELCPNGILPAPTPTVVPETGNSPVKTPVGNLPPDISGFKPAAANIVPGSRGQLILSIRTPRLGVGIATYQAVLTSLSTKKNKPAKKIKINSLGGLIKGLKPGLYHLSYRVLATDGQLSQYSGESKTVKVK